MDNDKNVAEEPGDNGRRKHRSRQEFLGASIVAGGAVYLDPTGASAKIAGLKGAETTPVVRLLNIAGDVPPITPKDLAALASGNPHLESRIAAKYPGLKFGHLRSMLDAVIQRQGVNSLVFASEKGPTMCCSCSSCQQP